VRKLLYIFLISFAFTSSPLADEGEPGEMARNWLFEHPNVQTLTPGGDVTIIASTEDFARHFPIGRNDTECKPNLKIAKGPDDSTLTLDCPAFWGSSQRLKLRFQENLECGHACNMLILREVRVNGKQLNPSQLAAFAKAPFRTFATFQSFLLDPNVKVYAPDGSDLGKLRPSILRLWEQGYNCEIIAYDDVLRTTSVLCPYNANTSDPRTFDMTLCSPRTAMFALNRAKAAGTMAVESISTTRLSQSMPRGGSAGSDVSICAC
jgi:hypothetical protein